MKYKVISKRTGETVAEVSRIREAYNAVNALEGHDVRVDRFEPDNYIIKEVPEWCKNHHAKNVKSTDADPCTITAYNTRNGRTARKRMN